MPDQIPEFVAPGGEAAWLAFTDAERAQIIQTIEAMVPNAGIQWHPLPQRHDAIEKLIQSWEQTYRETRVAMDNSPEADADYWRWCGIAARVRNCLEELLTALGRPVPDYRSEEWRNGRAHRT